MPTKTTKTVKTVKPVRAIKPAKAVKTAKPAKAVKKVSKAVKPAADELKEANRLRQQRFLETHRDEINEKRREKYAARKESGQCPRCGKKLRSLKSTLCKDCLEKARVYNQS